jgi:hypothetical protein
MLAKVQQHASRRKSDELMALRRGITRKIELFIGELSSVRNRYAHEIRNSSLTVDAVVDSMNDPAKALKALRFHGFENIGLRDHIHTGIVAVVAILAIDDDSILEDRRLDAQQFVELQEHRRRAAQEQAQRDAILDLIGKELDTSASKESPPEPTDEL